MRYGAGFRARSGQSWKATASSCGVSRAWFRRDGLIDWRVEGEDLCLLSDGVARALTPGTKEAAGWMDIKASAASDGFTATLCRPPKA